MPSPRWMRVRLEPVGRDCYNFGFCQTWFGCEHNGTPDKKVVGARLEWALRKRDGAGGRLGARSERCDPRSATASSPVPSASSRFRLVDTTRRTDATKLMRQNREPQLWLGLSVFHSHRIFIANAFALVAPYAKKKTFSALLRRSQSRSSLLRKSSRSRTRLIDSL